MNAAGVKRAKYVLLNIRDLNNRVVERDKARKAFNSHLENLKRKPSSTGFDKARKLAEELALTERKLSSKGINESKRVEKLKKQLAELKEQHSNLKKELVKKSKPKSSKKMDFLVGKPKKSAFITKTPYSDPRKDFLREHLEELEHKLETSKLTKKKREEMNKKIKYLKKLL